MANLIDNWLNKEVRLGRTISKNIEEEFCNGYLFGEVLNKFKLIPNFSEYKNSNDEETKLKNLRNVEMAFKNMNIKLDKERILDIKSKKRGVAARFLYQIKMYLSKKEINFDSLMLKKAPDVGEMYNRSFYPHINKENVFKANSKDKNLNTEFNPLPTLTNFNDNNSLNKQRVNSSINPTMRKPGEILNLPKNIPLKKRNFNQTNTNFMKFDQDLDPIKRFEEFKNIQEQKITEAHNTQNNFFNFEKKKLKEKIYSNEKDLHLKKVQKDELEKKNFLVQLEIGKIFDKKKVDEKNLVANNYKKFLKENFLEDKRKTYVEIDKFEKHIEKLGLNMNMDSKLKRPNTLIDADIFQAKIREQIKQKENSKKEKERRIRKINNEQNIIKDEIEAINGTMNKTSNLNFFENKNEDFFNNNIDMMRNTARDKRIEYEKVRDLHSRDTKRETFRKKNEEKFRSESTNNDPGYESFYSNANDQFMKTNYFTSKESIKGNGFFSLPKQKFNKDEYMNEVYTLNRKEQEKHIKNISDIRKKNLPIMKELAEYILDFAEEIHKYETENKTDKIPVETWSDYIRMFINNEPFSIEQKETKNFLSVNSENSFNKNSNLEELADVKSVNFINNDTSGIIDDTNIRINNININRNNLASGKSRKIERKVTEKSLIILEEDNSQRLNNSVFNFQSNLESIEENELFDYVNFLGNFKENNEKIKKEKMLDIFDLMKVNENAKKHLNSHIRNKTNLKNSFNLYENTNMLNISKKDYELKDEDIENLKIPEKNVKNNLLTDVINIIAEIKFSENSNISEIKKDSENIFDYIPLKLSLIGKDFSGKKTQIKNLQENFNLTTYDIYEIINTNIETMERLEIPIENLPKYKIMKKVEIDKLISERQLEEENLEWMKEYLTNFRDLKTKNIEFNDSIVIEFLIELIKKDFPKKSKEENLGDLVNRNKRKKEINEEIEKLNQEKIEKSTDQKPTKNQKSKGNNLQQIEQHIISLNEELKKIQKDSNLGFILLNFPRTLKQAKLLEKKISNNIDPMEKIKSQYEIFKDNSFVLLDKFVRPTQKQELINSSLDLLFSFEIEDEEAIRRIKNRKIDPSTGQIYHLEDNPPPSDDKRLLERLHLLEENPILDQFENSSKNFDEEIQKIYKFFYHFGIYSTKENFNVKMLNKLNLQKLILEAEKISANIFDNEHLGTHNDNKKEIMTPKNKHKDEIMKRQIKIIHDEILKQVNSIVKINEKKEDDLLLENVEISNNSFYNNNSGNTSKNMSSNHNISKENINSASLTKLNSGISKDNISRNESKIKENQENYNNNINKIEENEFEHKASFGVNVDNSLSNIDINNSVLHNNMVIEEYLGNYNKKLEEAKKKIPIGIIEKLFNDWVQIYEKFSGESKIIFKNMYKQRENIVVNFNKIQDQFIEFLKRKSNKNIYVNNLKDKYNKFTDEYPSLRLDAKVKEEFHQDVSEMQDYIWEIIQQRSSDSIFHRKNIISKGLIESEMEKFYSNFIEKLFIIETEKFYSTMIFLKDYYSFLDNKLVTENFTFKPIDILLDFENEKIPLLEEIAINEKNKNVFFSSEENYRSPRIEKLYKNCFKLIILYEDIKKNLEKQKKNVNQNSISTDSYLKGAKSQRFNKKIDYLFSDDKKDVLFLEEELKNSIKNEKIKFKYRITFLKNWGLNNLKDFKNLSEVIFKKMDDWIISSVKYENDAMNNLLENIDRNIESGIKMKIETELDVFDIYRKIDSNYHFQITSNPVTELPFRVMKEKTSIDLDKYLNIFNELKQYQIFPSYIRSITFKDIFIMKNLYENKNPGIPSIFTYLSSFNINKLIKNFENLPIDDKEITKLSLKGDIYNE